MHEDVFHAVETMLRSGGLSAYYPNPDDPGDPNNPWGPYGPIGPVANLYQRLIIAALNPQPLPPVGGPQPDPWRAQLTARAVINQAFIQSQLAEMAGDGGRQREQFGQQLNMLVDWWCGTPPRPWPFPWPPPPWWREQFAPEELVIAGLQFRQAARYDTPFQSEFAAAADRLLETGMGGL